MRILIMMTILILTLVSGRKVTSQHKSYHFSERVVMIGQNCIAIRLVWTQSLVNQNCFSKDINLL